MGSVIDTDLSHDEFFEEYMKQMDEVGEEIFGINYMDEYIGKFPVEEQDNVREGLLRLSESLHSGHNTTAVVVLVNKCLIKNWLEMDDVRDGYGNLI